MKNATTKLLSLFCAVAMLFALASCTNSNPDPTSGNSEPAGGGEVTPSDQPQSSIVRGGNLTYGRRGNFNPNFLQPMGRTGDRYHHAPMYETLFFKNVDGSVDPFLATDYKWEDDTTLVITLRDDVNYQDGGHMTAETVKYCLDWSRSEEAGASWRTETASIESIEATDTYTLQINLSKPDAFIIATYCNLPGIIVSPESIDAFKESENGLDLTKGATGPFMLDLDQYVEGVSAVYVKNPNYYLMGEDGQPLPYLDSISISIISDEAVKTVNLQSRDLLVADVVGESANLAIANSDPNIVVQGSGGGNIVYLRYNTDLAPFNDIRVRQAFTYATDTRELAEVATGSADNAVPFVIAPNQWYFVDDGYVAQDIEKAKSLLAEAGYADGLTVDVYYTSQGVIPQAVELLQMQLKEAGITLNLQLTDSTAILTMFDPHNDETPAGLMFAQSGIPGLTEYVQLYSFFGENATRDASKLETPEIRALLESMISTTDEDARYEIVKQIQALSLEENVFTHVMFTPGYAAWDSSVHDIVTEGNAALYFTRAWIDSQN